MRLEREQRRFDSRKKRGAENQGRDDPKQNGEGEDSHFLRLGIARRRVASPWRGRGGGGGGTLGKAGKCWFAHSLSCEQIKRSMNKGERISQFVAELTGDDADPGQTNVANHPFYR